MPKAKPAPKTSKKSSKPVKVASKAKSVSRSSGAVPFHKKEFLAKEQADFHKQHPMAEKLIGFFILAVVLLMVVYYMKYGLNRIMY